MPNIEPRKQHLTETNRIVNRSPAVTFLLENTPHWPIRFISKNVLNLPGFSVSGFMEGRITDAKLIHPEDLDRVKEENLSVTTAPNAKSLKHKPYRIITKNGTDKWLNDITSMRRDGPGIEPKVQDKIFESFCITEEICHGKSALFIIKLPTTKTEIKE